MNKFKKNCHITCHFVITFSESLRVSCIPDTANMPYSFHHIAHSAPCVIINIMICVLDT
jgi:hypothetical protein